MQLASLCRNLKDLADQKKFDEIVTLAHTLLEESYQLDRTSTEEIKCAIDTIMIYALLDCACGIYEQIENLHMIIDPIIIRNILLTNRFEKYTKNKKQDIGVLYDLPDLALDMIKKALIKTI